MVQFSPLAFLASQMWPVKALPEMDFTDKTIIGVLALRRLANLKLIFDRSVGAKPIS